MIVLYKKERKTGKEIVGFTCNFKTYYKAKRAPKSHAGIYIGNCSTLGSTINLPTR